MEINNQHFRYEITQPDIDKELSELCLFNSRDYVWGLTSLVEPCYDEQILKIIRSNMFKFRNQGYHLEGDIVGLFMGLPIFATKEETLPNCITNGESLLILPGVRNGWVNGEKLENLLLNFRMKKYGAKFGNLVSKEPIRYLTYKSPYIENTWVGPPPRGSGVECNYFDLVKLLRNHPKITLSTSKKEPTGNSSDLINTDGICKDQLVNGTCLRFEKYDIYFYRSTIKFDLDDNYTRLTDWTSEDQEICTQNQSCGDFLHSGWGSVYASNLNQERRNFICVFEGWKIGPRKEVKRRYSWGKHSKRVMDLQVKKDDKLIGVNAIMNCLGLEKDKVMSPKACLCKRNEGGDSWALYNKWDCWAVGVAYTLKLCDELYGGVDNLPHV